MSTCTNSLTLRGRALLASVTVLALAASGCGSDDGAADTAGADADDRTTATGDDSEAAATGDDSDAGEDIDLASHFSGEMEIVVPHAPGGGYDLIGRLIQKHLPDYLPGDQRIVVSNITGAEEVNAARHVMQAPADGKTLLHFGAPLAFYREFLGQESPAVRFQDFEVLGSVYNSRADRTFWCLRTDVAEDTEAAFAQAEETGEDLTFSMQIANLEPLFVESLENVPADVVYGYDGSTEALNAVDSGETDGTAWCHPGSFEVQQPHWLDEDVVFPAFSVLSMEEMEFFDRTDWERPPLLEDLVELSDAEQGLLRAVQLSGDQLGWHLGVPEAVPDPVATELKRALEEMSHDEEFRAGMEDINRPPGWIDGEEFYDVWEELKGLPQEVHDAAEGMLLR